MPRRNKANSQPDSKRSHTKGSKAARRRPSRSSQGFMDKQVKKLQKELAIDAARYDIKAYLRLKQKGRCANCGVSLGNRGEAHHRLVRRQPDNPDLYTPENMTLICNECHTPEAPDLGYNTTLFAFRLGITTPEKTEGWLKRYNQTRKCSVSLPDFYWRAKEDYLAECATPVAVNGSNQQSDHLVPDRPDRLDERRPEMDRAPAPGTYTTTGDGP